MEIKMTELQFRRLLDMAYIGNWILNELRGLDRFADYDEVESLLFSHCSSCDMPTLVDTSSGFAQPSEAYINGGIHEAIAEYEDSVFFEILAEELARRDLDFDPEVTEDYSIELSDRIDEYIKEFEQNGIDNISLDK